MQNSLTQADLMSSSSPTFIFESPDVVNMDGLLASDSNDSSSSSTENALLHGHQLNHQSHPHSHHQHHQQLVSQSLYQQQPHTQYQNPQHGPHSSMQTLPEKRKLEELTPVDSCKQTDSGHKKTCPPNGKKTKGRVKIKMEFIDNKLRRYTTFSKRKTGIMKKVSRWIRISISKSHFIINYTFLTGV